MKWSVDLAGCEPGMPPRGVLLYASGTSILQIPKAPVCSAPGHLTNLLKQLRPPDMSQLVRAGQIC